MSDESRTPLPPISSLTRTRDSSFLDHVRAFQEAISASKSIAVVSHTNPDPDAYGSSCGIALSLEALGKSVDILNESGAMAKYAFIPGVDRVVSAPKSREYDLVIVCDCGEGLRVGDSLKEFVKSSKVINIDHHNLNSRFGAINIVDEKISSTAELIFELIYLSAFPFSSAVATALLAGIIADTGSFRYSSTSEWTFLAAHELLRRGAQLGALNEALYSQTPRRAVQLQSTALSEIQFLGDGSVAIVKVTEELLARTGADSDDSEGLVERARDIEGVNIAAFIRWSDGIWRVSLRSRSEAFDVSEVARNFGGGGHKVAAAFRWKKPLAELESRLNDALVALTKTRLSHGR